MWLSVDPMADKHPNISPYAYCAWNPVKLVDPDGNDWYMYTQEEGEKRQEYYIWKEGHEKSIEIDGNTYTNIGAFASIRGADGRYTNFFQNEWISHSTTKQSSQQLSNFLFSEEGKGVRSILYGTNSHLSNQSKTELLQGRVTSSSQFYNDVVNILKGTLSVAGTGLTASGAITSSIPGANELGIIMVAMGNTMSATSNIIDGVQSACARDWSAVMLDMACVVSPYAVNRVSGRLNLFDKKATANAWANVYYDLIGMGCNEANKKH